MTAVLHAYDNPESVRARKYLTGSHLVADAAGVEVAPTPADAVWSSGPATLWRYRRRQPARFAVPIVLVYAFLLRPYILDLVPGRSIAEFLLESGFDVFLLDWGDARVGGEGLDFEDYVAELLPEAVAAAAEHAGAARVTLFGHCQGGTMSAIYAAMWPQRVRNLVLFAAPIDFAPGEPGLMGAWTLWSRGRWYDPAAIIDATGTVPADVPTRLVATALAPARRLAGVTGLARQLRKPFREDEAARAWLGACRWVDDWLALPGAGFCQWIRDFYQGNDLVEGRFQVRGRQVGLGDVTADVLVVAGTKDYIAPVTQAATSTHFAGARSFNRLIVDAGHVGLVAGPTARARVCEPLGDWLMQRSGHDAPASRER